VGQVESNYTDFAQDDNDRIESEEDRTDADAQNPASGSFTADPANNGSYDSYFDSSVVDETEEDGDEQQSFAVSEVHSVDLGGGGDDEDAGQDGVGVSAEEGQVHKDVGVEGYGLDSDGLAGEAAAEPQNGHAVDSAENEGQIY
jgi:hypothetical protein